MLSMSSMACFTSPTAECAVKLFRMIEQVTEFGRMPLRAMSETRANALAVLHAHKSVQHLVVRDLVRLDPVLVHLREERPGLAELAVPEVGLQQGVVGNDVDEAVGLHLLEMRESRGDPTALHACVEERVVHEQAGGPV